MLVNLNWLQEWVDIKDISTQQLCDQLTMAGLEVDGVEPAAADFNGVVIAEIVACEKHPEADKLSVCSVNAGEAETLQIVCGAANARAGIKIPCAKVGAVLPGNFKIKKAKLRGVESFGMLCAAEELGMAESSDGLLELPQDAPIGTDIREYFQLEDEVVEVDLTPNRGDCLSILGLSREVATLNKLSLNTLDVGSVAAVHEDNKSIEVSAPDKCPRYVGRLIKNINNNALTPVWMQERLRRCGIRPISVVVDITNYVMLELGQPMHGFDADIINGGIEVRNAKENEKLVLLDGKELELNSEHLVIADDSGALALAGVMGGEKSGVTDGTNNIFFESAHFAQLALAGVARSYGLHTDSSHRFERGVDAQLPIKAIERATALLLEIAGGEAGEIKDVMSEAHMPTRSEVSLSHAKLESKLGMKLPAEEVKSILDSLEISAQSTDDGWSAQAPSHRFDIAIEEDLIEEVARIYGYDRLPVCTPSASAPSLLVEAQRTDLQVKDRLLERGLSEVITYSFIDQKSAKAIAAELEPLALANPISQDLSVMRPSLLAGLLKTIDYNVKRQQAGVHVFELGTSFVPEGEQLEQPKWIAAARFGQLQSESWHGKNRDVDFYDMKADVEAILAGVAGEVTFAATEALPWHPGQSAQVLLDGKEIGVVGAVHPEVAKAFGIKKPVFGFELLAESIVNQALPEFEEVPRFPEMRRDIALLLSSDTTANQVISAIYQAKIQHLSRINVFDVYKGEHLPEGKYSLALSLHFRDLESTLTDELVNEQLDSVVSLLKQELKAELRD